MAYFGDPRLPGRFWEKVIPVDTGCWVGARTSPKESLTRQHSGSSARFRRRGSARLLRDVSEASGQLRS